MCSRKVLTMSLNLRAEWEFFLIFEYATEVIACRDEKMLDALDSVDIKCGTDNFTAMKQFIDLTTGGDVSSKENVISEMKYEQYNCS